MEYKSTYSINLMAFLILRTNKNINYKVVLGDDNNKFEYETNELIEDYEIEYKEMLNKRTEVYESIGTFLEIVRDLKKESKDYTRQLFHNQLVKEGVR